MNILQMKIELTGVRGTFLSDIVLQVLSFVAENERTDIRQRQAAEACNMTVGTFYDKVWKFENIT